MFGGSRSDGCVIKIILSPQTVQHEIETGLETQFEGQGLDSVTNCKKNPKHVGFIPANDFTVSHLRDKYKCPTRRVFVVRWF